MTSTSREVSVCKHITTLNEEMTLTAKNTAMNILEVCISLFRHNSTLNDTRATTSSVFVCVQCTVQPTSPFCAQLPLTPISLQWMKASVRLRQLRNSQLWMTPIPSESSKTTQLESNKWNVYLLIKLDIDTFSELSFCKVSKSNQNRNG